jgi:DNA-binding response OmpR family regulator/Tfp pilus assembly protein PilF
VSQLAGRDDSRQFRLSQLPGRDDSRAFRLRELMRGKPARPGEPSVLLVGAPETLSDALEPALARHKVHAMRSPQQDVVEAVVALAPDLVVLAGDAAKESGQHILRALALSPQSSVVPVAILGDNAELEVRLQAFRHGAAAVIPRSASMDEMAERIAMLAREIPERETEAIGDVGEATLQELVGALEQELRAGILSVRGEGNSPAVRIVLGGGRALTDTIDDFVSRVREHIVTAEPLKYEFDERAAGTVQLLDGLDAEPDAASVDVDGLRVVLADDDAARADAVAQELRERGVDVVVTDLDPSEVRFHRIRTMDPAVLLIGEHQAQGAGYELMRRMRRDTRLRWASLLVVRWDEVWSEERAVPAIERILGTLSGLAEPERALAERADSRAAFDTRLEITGPARLMRGLAAATKSVRVTVQNPRLRVRLDVSQGLVVGAMGDVLAPEPRELSGPVALAALMVVSSGRVHVEPSEQPQTTNLMSTPDVALNMADAEPPPIPPSIPTPAVMDARSSERPRPAGPKRRRKRPGLIGPVAYALGGLAGVLLVGTLSFLALRGKDDPKLTPQASTAGSKVPTVASVAEAPAPTPSTAQPVKPPAPPPPLESPKLSAEESEALSVAPTCEKLLGNLPPSPGVYPGAAYDQVRQARKELARGDLNGAQAAYCKAMRFDPKNAEAHAGLSRALLSRRDAPAAAHWAREAVKLKPEDSGHQILLGDALAMTGDLVKASDPLLLGYGITATDAAGRAKLVEAQLRSGEEAARKQDHAAAERAYRRAATLDSGRADAAAGVARALLEQGHRRASAAWGRKAATLDPRSAAALVVLGDALSKAGDAGGATRAWKAAVAADPNDPAARARAMTSE